MKKEKKIVKKSFDNIIDRLYVNAECNCFITIKDHKESFLNHPKIPLINPAKNALERISKAILDNKLFQASKIDQGKNKVSAIKWFKSLKDKHLMKFVMFDIKDFYSPITQDLLIKALNFASKYLYISKCDTDVINHARKPLLFDGSRTWIKKQGGLFDVSMGAYDRAEVCKFVGTYTLNVLSEKYNKDDFGLYHDDGLAVLKNKSGPQSDQVKKSIQKIFN